MCFKTIRVWSALAAIAASASSVAAAAPFQDVLVQAPSLGLPQRGSVAGSLSKLSFGAGDLSRGAYSLPLPIVMPAERGALGAEVFPSYSAEAGLGEFGMGWSVDLAIRRHRVLGELHFDDSDGYTSPWGRLEQGDDGSWYPAGLRSVVRVTPLGGPAAPGGWEAVTADGTRFVFAPADATVVADGTFAWQLSEVDTVLGDLTSLVWTRNPSGRPFLAAVRWGGRHDGTQYEAAFAYEDLPRPFASYASGTRLLLDRRVKSITARVKTPGAAFAERWRYDLAYATSPIGPAFYLTALTKRFPSGDAEPPVTYAYDTGAGQLATAQLQHNPALDLYLTAAGGAAIQPDRASMTDLEENGLTDLEHYYAFTTVRRTDTGYTFEDLPTRTGAENPLCRPQASTLNKPRLLARMRGDSVDPQVVVLRKNGVGQTSTLTLCDRPGFTLKTLTLAGNWELGANTRLADLNQDLRPDVVRVQNGAVHILWNVSTAGNWAFLPGSSQALTPAISANASWVIDVNGDGKADLMSRTTSGVVVWSGKGTGRFETTGAPMTFRTLSGVPLTNVAEHQFSHGDFNGDGLSDVILSKGQAAHLFLNQGHEFQQLAVPGLSSIPFSFGYPVVGDLTGSGNPEVVFVDGTKARSIALSTPATGLMTAADDGRGTIVRFGYRRITPEPGIIHRYALLDSLSVESSGYDPVTFSYAYAQPVWHSLGRFLVGFAQTTKHSPFLDEHVDFHHDDHVAGVVVASDATDPRTPGLVKFAHHDFEDVAFRGVPWRRLLGSEEGLRSSDGATVLATRKDRVSYAREICPAVVTTSMPGAVLTTEDTLASVAALPEELHCLPASQRLLGTHDDATLDFDYAIDIARNDAGQITGVVQRGPSGPLVLQAATYDGSGRLLSAGAPGRGQSVATYDGMGRLQSVTAADGTVTRVTAMDPLSDALLALETSRGQGGVSSTFYAYDGHGRLQRSWNDYTGASAAQPSQALAYRFADATHPAATVTRMLVDATLGVWRETVELQGADGATFATAAWADRWIIPQLEHQDRAQLTGTRRGRFAVDGHGTLATLGNAELIAAAGAPLEEQLLTGFGQVASLAKIWQAGVTGASTTTWALATGVLTVRTVDSTGAALVEERDAAGRTLRRTDATGVTTAYAYDALGRLVEITTPDGAHRVRFDGYGRVARVDRAGVASIVYAYDAATGLVVGKSTLAPDGAPVHAATTTYDIQGRPVNVEHTTAAGASRDFTFDYDGVGADGPGTPHPGQLGHMSRVTTNGYERRMIHDRAGRLVRSSMILAGGWRTVDSALKLRADGEVGASSLQVRDAAGATLVQIDRDLAVDAFGRPAALTVNGTTIYTLRYDDLGRLAGATLAGGHELTFEFDAVTGRRRGHRIDGPLVQAAFGWDYDGRGLVAAERFTQGDAERARTYGYDARRMLVAADEALGQSHYGYTASGLPRHVDDLAGARDVRRGGPERDIGGITYGWDALGRVVRRGAYALTYGPDGQLAAATSPERVLDFVYDETGARVLRIVDGLPETAFVAGGVLDASGFHEVVEVGGIVVGVLVDGVFTVILTDPRGTPLTDALGVSAWATPYGVRAQHGGLAAVLDFARGGHDADLGTVRMGARDYDPLLAQFWTPDPLYLEDLDKCQGSPAECNLFGYALGDPLGFTDPSGLDAPKKDKGAKGGKKGKSDKWDPKQHKVDNHKVGGGDWVAKELPTAKALQQLKAQLEAKYGAKVGGRIFGQTAPAVKAYFDSFSVHQGGSSPGTIDVYTKNGTAYEGLVTATIQTVKAFQAKEIFETNISFSRGRQAGQSSTRGYGNQDSSGGSVGAEVWIFKADKTWGNEVSYEEGSGTSYEESDSVAIERTVQVRQELTQLEMVTVVAVDGLGSTTIRIDLGKHTVNHIYDAAEDFDFGE